MKRWSFPAALFCVLALLACTVRPRVTNTGYTGTWSGGNDRIVSMIAIAKSGDRYFFRWFKHSSDRAFDVDCGWDGQCEERLLGRRVATYDFAARLDPATGHLMVECHERRFIPQTLEIHFVDELVVEPGGRVLRSYTIERDGQRMQGLSRPVRSFVKIADAVAGVPKIAAR